jgi:Fe-S cluster assembly protein SufD
MGEDKTINKYLKAFKNAEANANSEPAWLLRLREDAMASFAGHGFPAAKDDAWRYTDITAIREASWDFDGAAPELSKEIVEALKRQSGRNFLLVVNGKFLKEHSSVEEGIEVADIEKAILSRSDLLEPHLGRYAVPGSGAFSALNTGLFKQGIFIRIPENLIVKEPVHIVFLACASGGPSVYQVRNLILAGKKSKAAIVETYAAEAGSNTPVCHPRKHLSGIQEEKSGFPVKTSGNDMKGRQPVYFTNAVTEIVLKEGVRMEHCKIQRESPEAFHIAATQVAQCRGSSFVSFALSTGSRLMRNDCRVVLAEEFATCELNGLYLGNGDQVLDHQTFVDHEKSDGKSAQFFKGLLAGNSRGVFRGQVMVRRDAQRTDAHQTNKNLLLSDTAEADTQPQLEILADDVKCGHGAAVGQLQEDALFYLRSRGIDEKTAGHMLAQGFAREVIERSSLGFMKETLLELVDEKLEKQFARNKGQSAKDKELKKLILLYASNFEP